MSLPGLVRHTAGAECGWFGCRLAGLEAPKRYQAAANPTSARTGRPLNSRGGAGQAGASRNTYSPR